MSIDTPHSDDTPILIARRERLRTKTQAVIAAEEARPLPETYVETARAMQAAALADRVLSRLSDDAAEPVICEARQHLRVHADRLLDILESLPTPDSFRMSLSALRCVLVADRLFVQLYSAPKATKATKAPAAPSKPTIKVPHKPTVSLFDLTEHYACQNGVWPDGSAFDPDVTRDDDEWTGFDQQAVAVAEHAPDAAPDRIEWQVAVTIAARINAMTRHAARKNGIWPDNTRFYATDPDYYALSVLFAPVELGSDARAQPNDDFDEIPGPNSFPWWLVRRIPAPRSG